MASLDGETTSQAAGAGIEEGGACPALGLAGDRMTHALLASPDHSCFAATVTRKIPFEHQSAFCLTTNYHHCPIWQQSSMNPDVAGNGPGRSQPAARLPRVLRPHIP